MNTGCRIKCIKLLEDELTLGHIIGLTGVIVRESPIMVQFDNYPLGVEYIMDERELQSV